VAYALSDEMKIIDLRWFWRLLTTSTVDYLSDSWVSGCHLSATKNGIERNIGLFQCHRPDIIASVCRSHAFILWSSLQH